MCILPSSLTRGRSCALDYSSFLPVSVSGTVHAILALDSISRHLDSARFGSTFSPLARGLPREADLPASLDGSPFGRELPFSRRASPHASCLRIWREYLTLHRFPIGYGFLPCLRGRLTQGRLPLPWKPLVFGGRGSHPSFRYLYLHSLFQVLQSPSRVLLRRLLECSPTSHTRGMNP